MIQKNSNKVTVPDSGVYHLIHQAYTSGGKYQWVREALVNAIQADATWIKFGIEPSGFQSQGIVRRYVADNGEGMSEDEIGSFLGSFGGGGRPISDHGNFGQGFKSSCLEWNPYGIIVISKTKKEPRPTMIWIELNRDDPLNPTWQMKEFDHEDGQGIRRSYKTVPHRLWFEDLGIDHEQLILPEMKEAGQGTTFLFLGDGPSRDTDGGDYLRGEEKSRVGIVKYINTRFLKIPDGTEVVVENREAVRRGSSRRETKDKIIKSAEGKFLGIHSRRPKGILSFIADESATGQVGLARETTATWFLEPVDSSQTRNNGPAKPVICLAYDGEAYDVKTTVRDYRPFGITDSIRDRVWLILDPPKSSPNGAGWGVQPQGSRGSLIVDGGEIPWHEWQDSFATALPRELSEAISEARKEISVNSTEERRKNLERTMSRYSARFRPQRVVENSQGSHLGTDGGERTGESRKLDSNEPKRAPGESGQRARNDGPVGGTGKEKILRLDDEGTLFGEAKRRSDGIPAVIWDHSFREGEDRFSAARFDQNETLGDVRGVVYLNLDFPMFVNEFEYWQKQYPAKPTEDIDDIVKQVYEDEVLSKVLHARKMMGVVVSREEDGSITRISDNAIQAWLSPESLTVAIMGLINVDSRIASLVGNKLGR